MACLTTGKYHISQWENSNKTLKYRTHNSLGEFSLCFVNSTPIFPLFSLQGMPQKFAVLYIRSWELGVDLSRVFCFGFCDVATVVTISTRGKSQIWLQVVQEDSRYFLESCYVLATSQNAVSKYGNFRFFSSECDELKSILKKSCYSQKNRKMTPKKKTVA
jgi:hypothetical protein